MLMITWRPDELVLCFFALLALAVLAGSGGGVGLEPLGLGLSRGTGVGKSDLDPDLRGFFTSGGLRG